MVKKIPVQRRDKHLEAQVGQVVSHFNEVGVELAFVHRDEIIVGAGVDDVVPYLGHGAHRYSRLKPGPRVGGNSPSGAPSGVNFMFHYQGPRLGNTGSRNPSDEFGGFPREHGTSD